jgi:sec-independent protein translocase protein TatA
MLARQREAIMGFAELFVVVFVVLLIFGAHKIPQLGDALGQAVRNYRKQARDADTIDVTPKKGAKPPAEGGSRSA